MTTTTEPRTYDMIGFGDEVPGVLALVSASREYQRRFRKKPRLLLMFKGDSQAGVGGHLVRGKLAYLDRSSIAAEVRKANNLPTFGDPAAIYKEFLERAGVAAIALDPIKANTALRSLLSDANVDIISRIEIGQVIRRGDRIHAVQLTKGEVYQAALWLDSTVNAELAQAAGVPSLKGFATFGLPESELPVSLVFETVGLTIKRLQDVELVYLRRFANPNDSQAQQFLLGAAGKNPTLAKQFQVEMASDLAKNRTMFVGKDYIDVRSRALSLAYHAFRGKALSLKGSGYVLDRANIAVLGSDRLSWNALMFFTTGSQAIAYAQAKGQPSAAMLTEFDYVTRWFKTLGAQTLNPGSELYIRHAGNVLGAVAPLTGAQMLAGGVPSQEALGTFGYYLDVRGGIDGLGPLAAQHGLTNISFHTAPLFNYGIQHALLTDPTNLAVVSPASGFEGYACAAGRIVEFNVGVGQGVGIASAIALHQNRPLASIRDLEVRQVLAATGKLPKIYGRADYIEAARLAEFETILDHGAIA